jgi:hypothetical protein
MGKGNVAKAAQKRERNAKKNAASKKGGTSQLKNNEKAKTIICDVCMVSFMCTASRDHLAEHAENRHNKTMQECFPNYVPPEEKKE